MIFLFLLTGISFIGVLVALVIPGWTDLILLAGPCALASLFLLLRERLQRSKSGPKSASRFVIVDGSNVLYWKGGTPQIETVQEVVRHLAALGFTPGVVFDANAGYLISGKYRHDGDLGKMLNLPKDRVMVVPKGSPADPTILAAAREMNALVVTNDRYRDWADSHPEVLKPGYLIRGGYQSGQLRLNIQTDTK